MSIQLLPGWCLFQFCVSFYDHMTLSSEYSCLTHRVDVFMTLLSINERERRNGEEKELRTDERKGKERDGREREREK